MSVNVGPHSFRQKFGSYAHTCTPLQFFNVSVGCTAFLLHCSGGIGKVYAGAQMLYISNAFCGNACFRSAVAATRLLAHRAVRARVTLKYCDGVHLGECALTSTCAATEHIYACCSCGMEQPSYHQSCTFANT